MCLGTIEITQEAESFCLSGDIEDLELYTEQMIYIVVALLQALIEKQA